MTGSALSLIGIALMAGNFSWQAMTAHDWDLAADRSFFQSIAILCVYISLRAAQ